MNGRSYLCLKTCIFLRIGLKPSNMLLYAWTVIFGKVNITFFFMSHSFWGKKKKPLTFHKGTGCALVRATESCVNAHLVFTCLNAFFSYTSLRSLHSSCYFSRSYIQTFGSFGRRERWRLVFVTFIISKCLSLDIFHWNTFNNNVLFKLCFKLTKPFVFLCYFSLLASI